MKTKKPHIAAFSFGASFSLLTSSSICTNTVTPINPGPIVLGSNYAFWPSTSTGGIAVAQTFNGTANPVLPLIADPAQASGAVVVLISYGKNGYGAFNTKGGQNDYAAAGSDEKQNADAAKLITAGNPPAVTTVKRDTTEATTGGGAFDDIVLALSANDLTGPLTVSGQLFKFNNGEMLRNLLLNPEARISKYCDQRKIQSLIDRFLSGQKRSENPLYRLISAELWLQECIPASN